MARIDWDELGRIEDSNHGWRVALAHDGTGHALGDLSSVYVSGEGGEPVEAFIIGEAPGAQEEAKRRPFIGPAGVAMRDLMAIADLYADQALSDQDSARNGKYMQANCWLTNTVKFRPPRNRNPTLTEITAARPWLRAEWVAVGRPRVIVPVGGIALHAVTGKKQSILVAAGKLHKYRSREGIDLCIWPMVHPSYGIRGGASVQAALEQDWDRFADWMKKARQHGWLKHDR